MDRTTISDDHVLYDFTPDAQPEWRVSSGEQLEVHTRDSVNGKVQSDNDVIAEVPDDINPATGPIAIDGAEPGDVLKVAIEDIRLREEHGRILVVPDFGLQQNVADLDAPRSRVTEINDGSLQFQNIEIDLSPMIGIIGVAPAKESYTTLVPHDHGGNLDTTDISAGSTVYFPVFQQGAMLAMGDSKAAMADGETCGTGSEIGTEIDVTVDIISQPQSELHRPLIETEDSWKVIASADTLEEACKLANQDLCEFLMTEYKFDFTDAYMFSTLVANLEISQVVDPLKTVRNTIPKQYLSNPLETD
jgi:amidase